MKFSLLALMRQILGSLCQILMRPVRRWTKPDNHAVLAENAHPFEDPPLRVNNPFGLFGLTS
jgi:hypothetical protein